MKNKSLKMLGITLCMTMVIGLTACGSTESTSSVEDSAAAIETVVETTEEIGENSITFSEEYTDTTFTGRVTAVDGDTITLESMGFGGGAGMGKPGERDESTSESNDSSSEKEHSDKRGSNEKSSDGDSSEKKGGKKSSDDKSSDSSSSEEKPEGGEAPADGEAPAEMPSGEGEAPADGQAPADMPSGEGQAPTDGEAPADMPSDFGGEMSGSSVTATLVLADTSVLTDSEGNAIELSEISEGTILTVTLDESGNVVSVSVSEGMQMGGDMGGQMGGDMGGQMSAAPGGSASGVDSYDSVYSYTEDATISGEALTSTGTDENVVNVSEGASVTLDNVTITRTSSDSTGGDNSSFYGVGAAVLTTDGEVYVNDSTIDTSSAGGAGVFAYGDGVAYVANTTINTTENTSGGIHAAGGGTLYAWDLDVTTAGGSAAAIRSDRGGGTMVVDGGTYTSNGSGSPAVYCTADISINNATLTATGSEAICIEGLNSLKLYDCDLTGNIPENDQNEVNWNVIVYQSMSGDSEVGNGTFSMIGGSLTALNGGMFYTTNTESTFYLEDVAMTYSPSNEFFLRVTGNANARGWGSTGANGADTNFTAVNQEMEGDVIYDSISTLDFYMMDGSILTGAVIDDESYAGEGGDGYCNLYISSDSVWVVTGDSLVTNLYNEGTIVDEDGNIVTIVDQDGNVLVQGSSDVTITVGNYSETADFSGCASASSFEDVAVENPFA